MANTLGAPRVSSRVHLYWLGIFRESRTYDLDQ